MATFYLDYENGSDAADGSDWANAWKTITSGATAARIAPGDIIRIAKSPDPTALAGTTAKWENCQTGGGFPATKNIASSTNASPVVVTINTHGYSNGDVIQIIGHTSNASANGAWVIANVATNTFELVGSVGVGTGGANGTAQKINSKAVVLTAAETADIDRCEIAWTANGAGDTTVAIVTAATDAKEGGNAMRLTLDSAPQTNILQAYKTIASTNFSAYQKISFWIKNSAAIANATTWKVCLCSDTAGATVVDTFNIPAIPSTAQWLPLTLTKSGGGNLGSAIQSIAVWTDASAPANSSNILVDNFIACTTAGLNLQSLISKNSLAQGGDEGWYGIQSIVGTTVLLDNHTNNKANAGRGYSTTGTTPETVATYKRETIKTDMVTSSATAFGAIQDSGTLAGGYIEFQGGYNTSTSAQDGETFFDGLNGFGSLNANGKSYIKIEHLSFCRYGYGFYAGSSGTTETKWYVDIFNGSNCITAVYPPSESIIIAKNLINNQSYGISLGNGFTSMEVYNTSNNLSYGINFGQGQNQIKPKKIAKISYSLNNLYTGLSGQFGNVVEGCVTANNGQAGVGGISNLILRNCTITESTEVSATQAYQDLRISSKNHDNTANNHWVFMNGGTINSASNDRVGGAGLKWKYAISSSTRDATYPLDMVLMEIPVVADAAVTVTAYCKKDHASNVGAKLVCRGGQLAGVASDVEDTKANDTDWEQLTISFTPTESGVIEVEGHAYYVAGNSNVYFCDVSVTQA